MSLRAIERCRRDGEFATQLQVAQASVVNAAIQDLIDDDDGEDFVNHVLTSFRWVQKFPDTRTEERRLYGPGSKVLGCVRIQLNAKEELVLTVERGAIEREEKPLAKKPSLIAVPRMAVGKPKRKWAN